MNIINKFSTSELIYNNNTIGITQKLPINKSILELEIPELIQGFGSQVHFQLELEKNSSLLTKGNAVFSEGSVLMGKYQVISLSAFINYFYHHYINILILIFSLIIGGGLVIAYLIHRAKTKSSSR